VAHNHLIHEEDLGEALHLAWVHDLPGVYNVGADDAVSSACGLGEKCENHPIDIGCMFLGESALNMPENVRRRVTPARDAPGPFEEARRLENQREIVFPASTTFAEFSVDADTCTGCGRCTSRCWAQIRLPMGLKGPKFVSDISVWEFCSASSVTRLHVPVNPGVLVTNIRTRMGEDFSRGAYGMLWFDSNNREGFLLDGRMSPMEVAQETGQDPWRMIVGRQGALLNRAFWSPNFVDQARYVKAVWLDDVNDPDPFEFEPGQHAGYSVSEVANIHSGDYDLAIEWYMPSCVFDAETGQVSLSLRVFFAWRRRGRVFRARRRRVGLFYERALL